MTLCPAPRLGLPDLGVGAGLRIPHYQRIFDEHPKVDWFEIISENFMVGGGRPRANLERAREGYPLVAHGVSLSLGSANPLDWEYLKKLKALVAHVGSPWASDHLCWTGADCLNLHDLLPLPYTEEVVRYVAERARIVQDFLEVRFAIENVSSYMTFTASRMAEWEFLRAIAEEADVGILLDVNNVYVSSQNHGFDPAAFVEAVPHHRVVQIHLAGHTRFPKYILDTHSGHVIDEVWALYDLAVRRCGSVSTLVEWDDDIPELEVLLAELDAARVRRDAALAGRALDQAAGEGGARPLAEVPA